MAKPLIRLAPMAGITDWPFRLLCFENGCDGACTEMISAIGYLCAAPDNVANANLLCTNEQEGLLFVQVFGKDPALLAEAARKITVTKSFAGVDINMGCPARKIAGKGEGSALMLDPSLAERIIKAVIDAVSLPVSVKMRLGWDDDHINVVEFAQMAESCGVAEITVHGRTRAQQYSGKSDWDSIARVKASVSVPVYGNGDVFTGEDGAALLAHTGCDGVAIGRGALGNPWIFAAVKAALANEDYVPPTWETRVETAMRHAAMMVAWKGETHALPEMRKHIAWYVNGMRGAARMRARVNGAKTYLELQHILQEYVQEMPE